MVSTPPISSFMATSSQPEQPLRQTAIDGGALRVREFGLGDHLQRREIADRDRHIRTHHDPFSADDVGKVAQRARVLDNGVVIHRGERGVGIAELVLVERIIPAQAAWASRNTSAARAPSCNGTVASGTNRGSRIAVCARWVLISRDQVAPSSAGTS